jgi:uncharacterized protein YndB with AHSA1/START domain
MKWILLSVAALAGIGIVVALIGAALPRDHVASREVRLPLPPERVWAAITSVDAFPSWRPDLKRVERLSGNDGRTKWIEHTSSGRITFAVDHMDAPRVLVVRIVDRELPFGGTWTYEIAPAGGGSTLRITEHGEVYNPIFRFVSRFVFGHEKTISDYLAALERSVSLQVEHTHGI